MSYAAIPQDVKDPGKIFTSSLGPYMEARNPSHFGAYRYECAS